MGYAVGALLAGAISDAFGLTAATIALLTFVSGAVVALRMRETLHRAPSPSACLAPGQTASLSP